MSNLTRYDFATEKGYNHYSQYFPTSIGMWVKFDDIKELLNSSHNTGSPKLPTHEAVFEATGAEDRHRWVTQQFYTELCRQLRAGA